MDATRASRIAERKNSAVALGDEPLIVDLLAPVQGVHWVCSQITALGRFATRTVTVNPSATFGIYLVPVNNQLETLADGVAGFNQSARGIALPYDLYVAPVGAAFAFVCIVKLVQECIVPAGWVLRFIANVAPGTATPGPGAGSNVVLSAHVCEELNVAPLARRNV